MTRQDISTLLRALPSIDALLRTETARALTNLVGSQRLTSLARQVTDEMREGLQRKTTGEESGNGDYSREALLAEAALRLERAYKQEAGLGLQRVINASGVILHTNLGRAPLSESARHAISFEAARYCTLEYETESGTRGRRGVRVEKLLAQLTGAEDALVVNNCAAAVLLVLTVIAKGGETLISRGELVEIGGDFRIPDVMRQSGTRVVEVGTTNRTALSDYANALTDDTFLLMRVHPSNYRIVGFTAVPTLTELAELAQREDIPLYEDAGSGALIDLGKYGLSDEPVIKESIAAGADIVSFSGDKLLGSSQAGLIVGRTDLIELLRHSPLYRALRADKLALAALEATLDAYARETFFEEIPALRMLAYTTAEIAERASNFRDRLAQNESLAGLKCELIEGQSAIGGGSAPTTHPETILLALKHDSLSADALDQSLRSATPPVIARISEDRVLLDLRTVFPDEEVELLNVVLSVG